MKLIRKLRRDSGPRRSSNWLQAESRKAETSSLNVRHKNHIFPQEEVCTHFTSEAIMRCWWLAGWNLLNPRPVFCFSFTSYVLGTFSSLQTDTSFLFDVHGVLLCDNLSFSRDALVSQLMSMALLLWGPYVSAAQCLILKHLLHHFFFSCQHSAPYVSFIFLVHENTHKLNCKQNKSSCHKQTWNFFYMFSFGYG